MKPRWRLRMFLVMGLVLLLLVVGRGRRRGGPVASIYSTGAFGASLVARLLSQDGWVVEPWQRSLVDLAGQEPGLFVMVSPETLQPSDLDQSMPVVLRRWLEKGGRIAYFGRFAEVEVAGTEGFFLGLWKRVAGLHLTPELVHARVPHFWDIWRPARPAFLEMVRPRTLRVVTTELVDFRWHAPTGAVVQRIITFRNEPLVVRIPIKKGDLVVGWSAAWLENRFVSDPRAQNARALLALLRELDTRHRRRVWIDEFHHGFLEPVAISGETSHVRTVDRWLWIYGLLLGVLAAYAWSRRPGPVHRLALPEAPSGTAFLYQVAGLMAREGFSAVARTALEQYLGYLGRRYRHQIQVDPGLHELWRRAETGVQRQSVGFRVLARYAVDLTRRLRGSAQGAPRATVKFAHQSGVDPWNIRSPS